MGYKILVITDHFTHGEGESIYPLLKEMRRLAVCSRLDVASRGNSGNRPFFHKHTSSEVYVPVDDLFEYDIEGKSFVTNTVKRSIQNYDLVFLRIDRPYTQAFVEHLTKVFPQDRILNQPEGMKITGSKEFLLRFPELCPPIQLCTKVEDVEALKNKYPIVLKPLENYGGNGLIKIEEDSVLYEGSTYAYSEFKPILSRMIGQRYLAMKYLRRVLEGDKRVIVVNGKIMGATLRMPPPNSYICNLSQGGCTEFAEPNDHERHIARVISPVLKEHGIAVYGFDTLVDDDGRRVLSEINTLNVGGLLQAERHSGRPVIQESSQAIWEFIREKWPEYSVAD